MQKALSTALSCGSEVMAMKLSQLSDGEKQPEPGPVGTSGDLWGPVGTSGDLWGPGWGWKCHILVGVIRLYDCMNS